MASACAATVTIQLQSWLNFYMNVCIVWLPPGSKNRTFHHSRRLFSLATFSTGTTPLTREPVLASYSFASHFDRICINEISIWYLVSFLSVTFVWLCDSVVFFFLLNNIYIVYMNLPVYSFFCWWIFGLLSDFCFISIMGKAAMKVT